jgi:hypothetical protein
VIPQDRSGFPWAERSAGPSPRGKASAQRRHRHKTASAISGYFARRRCGCVGQAPDQGCGGGPPLPPGGDMRLHRAPLAGHCPCPRSA